MNFPEFEHQAWERVATEYENTPLTLLLSVNNDE
jgi:hypothetical protein